MAVGVVVDGHAVGAVASGAIAGADTVWMPSGCEFVWFVVGSIAGACRTVSVVGVNHLALRMGEAGRTGAGASCLLGGRQPIWLVTGLVAVGRGVAAGVGVSQFV